MKKAACKRGAEAIQKWYPIAGLVEGWFFRQREVSCDHWVVEGTDLWGHEVRVDGGEDPAAMLEECARKAEWVQGQLAAGLSARPGRTETDT